MVTNLLVIGQTSEQLREIITILLQALASNNRLSPWTQLISFASRGAELEESVANMAQWQLF